VRSRALLTPLCASPSHVLQWPRRPLAQALLVFSLRAFGAEHRASGAVGSRSAADSVRRRLHTRHSALLQVDFEEPPGLVSHRWSIHTD
jgi:hypothetical protein